MCGDPRLGLELLRIGHCRAPAALTARGAGWWVESYPAGAALIRHPRLGNILFDTGYGASFFHATAAFPERLYRWLTPVHLREGEHLPRQLHKRGIKTPDMVILSHLHADHVAGLFDLPMQPSRVLASAAAVQALKLERLASLRAGCPLGLRNGLRRISMQFAEDFPAVPLASHGLGPFKTGYDILNDGSAIVIPLPGHACGQIGLYLPHLEGGPAFLIADATWSIQALRENRPPPRLTLGRLGNAAEYLDTFNVLHKLQRLRPDLRLIPSHCPQSFPDEVF